MKIESHRLKDRNFTNWFSEVEDHWDYRDFKADDGWRKDWISFDCLCYDEPTGTVYAGITSFDSDICWGFNTRKKEFVATEYHRIADPFDAKFHQSLVKYEKDGCLYAAIALLHDVDNFFNAPGGAIVRFDPRSGEMKKLTIPIPHVYIQSIVIDQERGVLYGQTFTPERVFSYDIAGGNVTDLGPIGSAMAMAQGENLVLDDRGRLWGAWGVTRAWQSSPGVDSNRLFCYDPDLRKMQYLDLGLPRADGKYGYEKPEAFFNLGNGCLYASGANGSIFRIDTDKERGEYLFTPVPDRRSRLAALTLLADGKAYGVTGRDGKTDVLAFDPSTETFQLLGPVSDKEGNTMFQAHDVEAGPPGIIYVAENDNPNRSGYLWEIEL